jgi:hypothetical protein
MAIWGAMLGFLLLLFAATEVIQDWQSERIMRERQQATAAALLHVNRSPAENIGAYNQQTRALVTAITDIDTRQSGFAASQRQNKILIVLLGLFIVGTSLRVMPAGTTRSAPSRRPCAGISRW